MKKLRPQPKVLLEKDGFEVLAATGLFAVVYQGEPINIRERKMNWIHSNRYQAKRSAFAHEYSARQLANKLNERFETDQFSIRELVFTTKKGK